MCIYIIKNIIKKKKSTWKVKTLFLCTKPSESSFSPSPHSKSLHFTWVCTLTTLTLSIINSVSSHSIPIQCWLGVGDGGDSHMKWWYCGGGVVNVILDELVGRKKPLNSYFTLHKLHFGILKLSSLLKIEQI